MTISRYKVVISGGTQCMVISLGEEENDRGSVRIHKSRRPLPWQQCSKLVVRMIMMTRIILSGIQEALNCQDKWVSQCEEELWNYGNTEKKFCHRGKVAFKTKDKNKVELKTKARRKQREQGRSAARQSLAVFVCDCRHPAACSQNRPQIKTEQ